MKNLTALLLAVFLAGCSILISTKGANNELLSIPNRSALLSKLGAPKESFDMRNSPGEPVYPLREATSYDAFQVRGKWAKPTEACTYGFLAMGTFGLSEVITVPLAMTLRITGAFSNYRLVAFYHADQTVQRFELYDNSGKPVHIRNHC